MQWRCVACQAWIGRVATVRAEAGVVTLRVSERAEQAGYVFAVDPTSQDASVSVATCHERRWQKGRAVGHHAG